MYKSTDLNRLERWAGAANIAALSRDNIGWYGPPIPVAGVPGDVRVCGDGNFIGECRAGFEATAAERLHDILQRLRRTRHGMLSSGGFSTIVDLLNEGKNGKRQTILWQKSDTAQVDGQWLSMFRRGALPAAGSAAGATPGGTVFTSASGGAMTFNNAPTGDKMYVGNGTVQNSSGISVNSTVLLYDRLFGVAKTMSSTTAEAVTGVPTRYTSNTPGAADYASGNFMFPEINSNLSGAHNWTVCQYTDQDGNPTASFPSWTGITGGNSAVRIDVPSGTWFVPLASGDHGVTAITQLQCDASITGGVDFVLGHALAWFPCLIGNVVCAFDGIRTGFNLSRVFDNACLCVLGKPTSAAGNYIGQFDLLAG